MGDITLRQALDDFKSVYLASRNYAVRSREEYINDLEDLIGFLEKSGFSKAGELGVPQIDRYLAELDRRGLAGSTRKRKAISVRSFLAFLYRERHITNDIAKQIILPFAESTLPRVLTQSEYQRLLKACEQNIRDTAIIELLLQTGIRLSELIGLRVSDIDFPAQEGLESGVLGLVNIIGGGGRKSRNLPLNSKSCQAIQAYLQVRPVVTTEVLFVNKTGEPLGERGVQKMVQKYMDNAGVKGASVESLRHTFGTHHAAKGTSLKTIQEVMGHRDTRTTEIYISLARRMSQTELEENSL
jgi:site-specific recombinase XerD